MTLPTYKIEIAFNAGVTTPAASRSWTDVTAYVLLDAGIDITYGRGDWRSEADANTLRLTLNNSDGRFTAGRSGSPYYPNVKLGRPIRVTATVGGVSSVRFVGFIDEWPLEWPAAVTTFATTEITASSRLAWLAEGMELRSIIEEEILLDSPVAYYTLGEPSGALSAGDTSGNNARPLPQAGTGPAVVFGSATGPGTDSLTAASFSAGKRLEGPTGVTVGSIVGSVECFVTTTATGALLDRFLYFNGCFLGMDSTGHAYAADSGGTVLIFGPVVNDGLVHHLCATRDGSNLVSFYVDGVLAGSSTATSTGTDGTMVIGPNAFSAAISHGAAYASALPATRVAAHATAGSTGFAGETPATRIARYASYADIAATELSLDTGQVPALTHLDTTGSTAVDMMRKIEATEEGILFDRADGLLGFHDRAHRYTQAPAFVLDVNQGQVGSGMEPRLDRATIRNDVTTSSPDGTVTAHVTNATSISTYGPARESIEVATSNADEPFEHASWLVNQYNDAQPRVPSLTVDLNNLPTTLTQSVLAAAVSTQFTVKNLPSQAAVSSQDYIIEGYSESIGSTRHSITFNISQATPYAVWTVEDPVYGQYDAYPIAL